MYECKDCGRLDLATQALLQMHQQGGYCAARVQTRSEDADQITGRLEVPKLDPDYFISNIVREEVNRIIALTDRQPENLALIGPAGSGKTLLALFIGAMRKSPTYITNAYTARSSDEWWGHEKIDLAKGGMYYEPSLLVEALETPGATVIINDFLLMQNKSVQNGLNDALDPNLREVWVDQMAHTLGRPIRVANRVLIIATWNEGSEYTGNIKISANILDRFQNRIYMPYPPIETQVAIIMRRSGQAYPDAKRLAEYGDRLRGIQESPVDISMRGLVQAAKKMTMGAHLRDALYFTVISGLPLDVQETALAALDSHMTGEEKEILGHRANKGGETWEAEGDGVVPVEPPSNDQPEPVNEDNDDEPF
jgi:hypothetical protein